jgi:rod shape-determining protein MreC
MENFFARYKNPLVLMAVLFIQVVALATQVKRQENGRSAGGGTRLIRVWTVTAFTPVEKIFVSTGHFFRNGWHNYVDLRDARKQNQRLQDEITRLQMEQARLKQDADQARRLQVLLDFREKYVGKTVAAQVIGTSGTEQSRMITIDKGSAYGIKQDAAVITPDGIVGKVKDVYKLSSQVLLINDHDSGVGVILEGTRLQGIVKGTSLGELQIFYVMSDEKVEAGEHVITTGGDRIFPKGLSVGTVTSSSPDHDNDPFLNIKVKPAADLNRLEEVLVVTEVAESGTATASTGTSMRAADILSQRLPSIPKQDANAPKTPAAGTAPAVNPPAGADPTKKPAGATPAQKPEQKKEAAGNTTAGNVPSTESAPAKSPTPAGQPASKTTGVVAGTAANGKPAGAVAPTGTTNGKSTGAAATTTGTTTGVKPAGAAPGIATSGKPAGGTAHPATSTAPSSKPATETNKPAGQQQSTGANAGGAAAPKPKATPPKKPSTPAAASGTSQGAPAEKKPEQPEPPPAPTPTATPEKAPR